MERIKLLAKRNGIQVIKVNPSHTSTIGMLKYSPQYMLTKDVASAYVIARKGLGLKEKIPKVYKDLLKKLKANLKEKLFQGLWRDPIWARAPASGGGGGSL
ncbi:MAG: hypothetical protein ACK4VK_05600 [Aquificaceae bacterium]